MSLLGKLMISVGMDTSGVDKGVKDVDGKTKTMGSKVAANVKKYALMGAAAGAVATVGFAGASLRSFAALEKGMNEVFTLMPGMSDAAMGAMTKDLQAFDREFGVLSGESVPALYQAISAGVPAGGVFDFLEVAQKAATGGVTDLQTAVDGITSVVNAYGKEVMSSTEASDAMFTAVRLGKTTMAELAANVSKVTPIASALGISFDDVMAASAALTSQGVPTEVAMTNLAQAFSELAKTGSVADEAFQKIAGKSFKDFIEGGGNVSEAFSLISQGAELSDKELVDMFGSIEAGKAVMGLTGKGAETFAANTEAMGKKAGATDAAYKKMQEGLSFAFKRIKASAATLMETIGERLAPTFQALADWIVDHMPEIEAAVYKAMDGIGAAFNWVKNEVIPRLITAFTTIKTWWAQNGPTIRGHWASFQEAVRKTYAFIKDTAVPWIIKEFNNLKTKSGPALSQMKDLLYNIRDGASSAYNFIKNNWEKIGPIVQRAWDVGKVPILAMLGAFAAIATAVNAAIAAIKDYNSTPPKAHVIPPRAPSTASGGNSNYRPRAAEGGNVSMSGGVLIGERGPEILNLPRGARVTPLDKAGGGITVQIENLYATSPAAAGAEIVRVVNDALRGSVRSRRLAPVMG